MWIRGLFPIKIDRMALVEKHGQEIFTCGRIEESILQNIFYHYDHPQWNVNRNYKDYFEFRKLVEKQDK